MRPTGHRPKHARPVDHDGEAFIAVNHTRDDLAELAGEEFVASAISGEEVAYDDRDRTAPEEIGGPFLEEQIPEEVMAMIAKENEAAEKHRKHRK